MGARQEQAPHLWSTHCPPGIVLCLYTHRHCHHPESPREAEGPVTVRRISYRSAQHQSPAFPRQHTPVPPQCVVMRPLFGAGTQHRYCWSPHGSGSKYLTGGGLGPPPIAPFTVDANGVKCCPTDHCKNPLVETHGTVRNTLPERQSPSSAGQRWRCSHLQGRGVHALAGGQR